MVSKALNLKPQGTFKLLSSLKFCSKFSGEIQVKITPNKFSSNTFLISEIFSPLGSLVPSDMCIPIKYGLLTSLIASIAHSNSLTLLNTCKIKKST